MKGSSTLRSTVPYRRAVFPVWVAPLAMALVLLLPYADERIAACVGALLYSILLVASPGSFVRRTGSLRLAVGLMCFLWAMAILVVLVRLSE